MLDPYRSRPGLRTPDCPDTCAENSRRRLGSVPARWAAIARAWICVFAVAVPSSAAHAAVDHFVATPAESIPADSIPASSVPNDFLDLERSLTECISSNPPPGCGRVPTSPGDRGGWQQLVLFGVMMTGMGVIFWRVSRAVRSRTTDGRDA